MSYRPPGTLGVLQLMAQTSMRRLIRSAKIGKQKRALKSESPFQPKARQATERKKGDRLGWLIFLMVPLFAVQGLAILARSPQSFDYAIQRAMPAGSKLVVHEELYNSLRRKGPFDEQTLSEFLSDQGVGADDRPNHQRVVEHWREHGIDSIRGDSVSKRLRMLSSPIEWRNEESRQLFVNAGSILLLLLTCTILASSLGAANATLAGGGWTQSWLMSFPVATRSLVLARSLEYSLVQFRPWYLFWPLCFQFLRAIDQPGALWISIGATLSIAFLTGALTLWIETQLRLRFSLQRIKSLQGVCTLLALTLLVFAFALFVGPRVPQSFIDLCAWVPDVLSLSPGAWPFAIDHFGWLAPCVGLLTTGLVFSLALTSTCRQLSSGFMRTDGVDPGRRGRSFDWRRHAKRLGVAGKDLLLLRRDRNFMVQILIVPVFVICLQLFIHPLHSEVGGVGLAMIAYFVGMYGCIGGCFQVLTGEGRALWMLYSLPVGLDEVLRRKTRVWATISLALSVLALAILSVGRGRDPAILARDFVTIGIGVWCCAHLAAGISVLGTDPTSDHVPRQPKARHVYLYLLFSASYFPALAQTDLFAQIGGITVFATLSYALWQRATDRVQWLLDPVAEPREHLTVFDGGLAVFVYFLLQTIAIVVAGKATDGDLDLASIAFGSALASGLTVMLIGARLGTRNVSMAALFSQRRGARVHLTASAIGLFTGAGLGFLGVLYVQVMVSAGLYEPKPSGGRIQLLFFGCLVAPVIEEFLFRGLVFSGLLRTVRVAWAILWSALLFTVVHGHVAWPPVFVLGVATAVLFRWSGFLPATMILHASYNFVVITNQ